MKQLEFLKYNDFMKQRRLNERNDAVKLKYTEKMNFFPFTAGDLVEEQRR